MQWYTALMLIWEYRSAFYPTGEAKKFISLFYIAVKKLSWVRNRQPFLFNMLFVFVLHTQIHIYISQSSTFPVSRTYLVDRPKSPRALCWVQAIHRWDPIWVACKNKVNIFIFIYSIIIETNWLHSPVLFLGISMHIFSLARLEPSGPKYCWNELITLSTKYRDLTSLSQLAFTVYFLDLYNVHHTCQLFFSSNYAWELYVISLKTKRLQELGENIPAE